MVSLNTGFHASAEVQGNSIRLSITVIPGNTKEPLTRFRDIPIPSLCGTPEATAQVLETEILDMWDEVIARETVNLALAAVSKCIRVNGDYSR